MCSPTLDITFSGRQSDLLWNLQPLSEIFTQPL